MEPLGIAAGVILLLILCASGSSKKDTPQYRIEATQDSRYYEVIDTNGESRHIGSYSSCEHWITEHTQ